MGVRRDGHGDVHAIESLYRHNYRGGITLVRQSAGGLTNLASWKPNGPEELARVIGTQPISTDGGISSKRTISICEDVVDVSVMSNKQDSWTSATFGIASTGVELCVCDYEITELMREVTLMTCSEFLRLLGKTHL